MGAVSANENSTEGIDNSTDLKVLIDNANDTVQLDEGNYCLNNDTDILINQSLTIEGSDNTVIDGNNNTLRLKTVEPKKSDNKIHFSGHGYEVKNTGKSIVFKGITFKDIKIVSWHGMIFKNCKFVNVNYTNFELDDSFSECYFNNTQLESCALFGSKLSNAFNIDGCDFYDSVIKTKTVYTSMYFFIVGSYRFEIVNRLSLTNSNLYNSNISMDSTNITINKSKLDNVGFKHGSSIIEIMNCEVNWPDFDMTMSKLFIRNSAVNNSNFRTCAGYFSQGSTIYLKNSTLNNSAASMVPNQIHSQKSVFTSINSTIENTQIDTTDTVVSIVSSELKNTQVLLFFSTLKLKNSVFFNNGTIAGTIKTKIYDNEPEIKKYLIKTDYTSTNSYLVNSTGKYLIKEKDIGINNLNKLIISKKTVYYYGNNLIIKLKDCNGKPVAGKEICIEDLKTYDTFKIKTDKKGTAVYKLRNIGKRSFNIYYLSPGFTYRNIEYGTTIKLEIKKIPTVVKAAKVTGKFKKSKFFKISVKNKLTKKAISKVKVKIKVYTGKKYKTYTVKTNKKGIAQINIKSLKVGNHKVVVSSGNKNIQISAKSMIKIKR